MKIEVRNDKVVLDGYVNAVERFSKVLRDKKGKFIEKIMPKVFSRAIERNDSIKVLLNHNYDRELANTKDHSAKLYEDNIGLRAIVETSDEEVVQNAKDGKLRGWSFGFVDNDSDEVVNDDGLRERSVKDIDLIEVSILNDKKIPAYVGTSIEMRDGEVKEILFRDCEKLSDDIKEENNSEILTFQQKRELLSKAFNELFSNGWLEDFDDNYVYGNIDCSQNTYKMPYSVSDEAVNIDTTNKIKVIRGGYKEIRSEDEPKQHKKVDYSNYENRIKKIKEDIK